MVNRNKTDIDYYGHFSVVDEGTSRFSLANSPFRSARRSVRVPPSQPLTRSQIPPNANNTSLSHLSHARMRKDGSERGGGPARNTIGTTQPNASVPSSSRQADQSSSTAARRASSHKNERRGSTGPMIGRMRRSEFATKLTTGERLQIVHESHRKRLDAGRELRDAQQFRERRKAELQEQRARKVMADRRCDNYNDVVDLTQTDVEDELKQTSKEEETELVSDDEEDDDIIQARINSNRRKSRLRSQKRLKALHPEPTTVENAHRVQHEASKEKENVITLSSDDEARKPSRLKRRRGLYPLSVSDPAFDPPSSDAGEGKPRPRKSGQKSAAKRRRSPLGRLGETIDAKLRSLEQAGRRIQAAKDDDVLEEKKALSLTISAVPAFPKDISDKGDGVIVVSDEELSVKTITGTPQKSGMKRVSEKKPISTQSFYGKEKQTHGGIVGKIHIPGLKHEVKHDAPLPEVIPLEVSDDEDVIECKPVVRQSSCQSLEDYEMPDLYAKEEPFFEPDSKRARDIRFRPMNSEELTMVDSLTSRVPKKRVMARIEEANIALKGEDFACLRGSRWLNDEILNSFAALINSRNVRDVRGEAKTRTDDDDVGKTYSIDVDENQDDLYDIFSRKRPRTHVFNTFFFPRLTQKGYDYNGVRRWLKRAGLSVQMLDLILIPINLKNFHWVLTAIDLRSKHFLYLDSTYGKDSSNTIPMLKRWLFDEVKDKHGAEAAEKMGINFWSVHINPPYLPRQHDGGSCGIFTLFMADYLERGLRPNFEQKHIRNLRRRTVFFLRDGFLPG